MRFKILPFLVFFSFYPIVYAQQSYTVEKASFSSARYDEFSPVFYRSGIVFCANRGKNTLPGNSDTSNKGQFEIFYIDTTGKTDWNNARLLSKVFKSKLNDGPVTFDASGNQIYFSRNLKVDGSFKDLSSPRNKLGLFYSLHTNNKWTKVKGFKYNNEWYNVGYNVTTPCLSPDGKRLYFASDMPGGLGGSDIYYCQITGEGEWDKPQNMGPVINTPGNESFPYINQLNELLFSSDGHPGLGGRDIFWSKQLDTTWLSPVNLEAPINSAYDDFGIVADTTMSSGFFSSNRDNTFDIFRFKCISPSVMYCTEQKYNQYCFMFSDSGAISIDTTQLVYSWNFGDGVVSNGENVRHCYGSPGQYNVNLNIRNIDGANIFTKSTFVFNISNIKQPFIKSRDFALNEGEVEFDNQDTNLPGEKILQTVWDFGDGTRAIGDRVKHSFSDTGYYKVSMQLIVRSDSSGRPRREGVYKYVKISGSYKAASDAALWQSGKNITKVPDEVPNARLSKVYSAEKDYLDGALFIVEIFKSPDRVEIPTRFGEKIPRFYSVKEIFSETDSLYHYIVDRQIKFMSAYAAYNDMIKAGFKDVSIKLVSLTDPAEKEFYNMLANESLLTETYFDSYERLTANAYILIDRVVRLMKKYPSLRLQIGFFSDNQGQPESNIALSKKRAQMLVSNITMRGVAADRLNAVGYGSVKFVANNQTELSRRQNRRVEFVTF